MTTRSQGTVAGVQVGTPPLPNAADLPVRSARAPFSTALGLHGTVLVDSGADCPLVHPEFARRLMQAGVPPMTAPCSLNMANLTTGKVDQWLCFTIAIRGTSQVFECRINAAISPTVADVVLDNATAQRSGILRLDLADTLPEDTPVVDHETYVASVQLAEPPTSLPESDMPLIAEGPHQAAVQSVVDDFPNLFDGDLTAPANVSPFEIKLTKEDIPFQPPRRLSPALAQLVRQEIDQLQTLGVIRPSTSPVASPIVMVQYPDGRRRMCVDYRAINSCTQPMRYPVRHARATVERLLGSAIFGKLDLQKGYHQIPLSSETIPLTSFVVPWGQYEYVRLPFGVRNGPAAFQRLMDDILRPLLYHGVEIFLDDILVHAVSIDQFLPLIRQVFERLSAAGLKVKASKSHLGFSSLEYLGYQVDGEGFTVSPRHQNAIMEVSVPKTKSDLRRFNGMVNYFRQHIPQFAWVAHPLFRAAGGRGDLEWTPACQEAFEKIKAMIDEQAKLYYLNYDLPIFLRTDASTIGVGGTLYQQVDGVDRHAAFLSLAFNDTQQRWATIEQEMFAVFYCVLQCSDQLLGHHFILETDHRNLQWLERATAPKVIRWRLRLQEFDYEIHHIPGRDNIVADTLSRLPAISVVTLASADMDLDALAEQGRFEDIVRHIHNVWCVPHLSPGVLYVCSDISSVSPETLGVSCVRACVSVYFHNCFSISYIYIVTITIEV